TNGLIYGMTQHGGLSDDGTFFSLDATLQPFANLFVNFYGKIGTSVPILGQGFKKATTVTFNGVNASFSIFSDNCLVAQVPNGATTGIVTVTFSGGKSLSSLQNFLVTPQILSFSPTSGPVGTQVKIMGKSLTQTQGVGFGNRVPAQFTVNSDMQVTATVPSG